MSAPNELELTPEMIGYQYGGVTVATALAMHADRGLPPALVAAYSRRNKSAIPPAEVAGVRTAAAAIPRGVVYLVTQLAPAASAEETAAAEALVAPASNRPRQMPLLEVEV